MLKFISNNFLSFNAISIVIGVAGFIISVASLFYQWEDSVRVKWVVLLLIVFASIILILIRLIINLFWMKSEHKHWEQPIKYLKDQNIILIRKNRNFSNNIIVGCYLIDDEIEHFVLLAFVHHIQEKAIQIKIIPKQKDEVFTLPENYISKMIIRPVIPTDILSELINQYQQIEVS